MRGADMVMCMRTTIEIPDALFRRAKQAAAAEGVTLREVVVRALRAHFEPKRKKGYVFRWRTEKGEQLIPDQVLNSRVALNEYLDQFR